MPTTVQTMVARTAEDAASRAIRRTLDERLGGILRPGFREGIGFTLGFTVLAVGLSVHARRRRLQRIEEKVEELAAEESEEVVGGDAAGFDSRREERRRRRLARREATS